MHQGGDREERERDRDRGVTINKHKETRIKFRGEKVSQNGKGPVSVMMCRGDIIIYD